MTRWKELPAGLDDTERQLVAQLRRLKDRAGLSLAALAARTSYSSSSWERYLNGKKPVPRAAAEELAEVCGAPAERLLVLHEVAETARAQRAAAAGDGARPHAVRPGHGASLMRCRQPPSRPSWRRSAPDS
ncbi:helix-turn-helix transcriptional regulator [Streptomyces sp. NPDC001137]|uniref:helix-turn-helix domain-containing protein n=1 Tax=Streptomyces sp. NPDC001137 TaxID=3154378 RepID=UPI00331AB3D7